MGRIRTALLLLAIASLLMGCSTPGPARAPESPPPSAGQTGGGQGATQIAPGLYDQSDGTVQAVGRLEYRDLEGGMWVIVGGSEATGDAGKTVAVIANPNDLVSELQALKGEQVVAKGQKFDGTSIRMAGPEITAMSIGRASDAPGAAQ
jgi:hypothetical protein